MGLKTRLLASGKTEDNEFNISLLGFKMAVNEGLTVFNLVDGVVDEFHDESGTDEGEGSNDTYCATSDFYQNLGPTGSPVAISAGFSMTAITEPQTSTAGTNPANGSGTFGTFTVPAGLTSVDVKVWGAGGGGGWTGYPSPNTHTGGGGGGYASGTLATTPSQVIHINAGEGANGPSQPNAPAYRGYFNAAYCGTPATNGSGGGGIAGLFSVNIGCQSNPQHSAPTAFIVAGAGGGGGHAPSSHQSSFHGGAGGGLTGCAGGPAGSEQTDKRTSNTHQDNGGGGDQEQGGQGGHYPGNIHPGSTPTPAIVQGALFRGGQGGPGGGGAGFYGGGAGTTPSPTGPGHGAGGGGSSYYGHPQVTSGATEEGSNAEAGGTAIPQYVACTSEGAPQGTDAPGEDGYVLIAGTADPQAVSSTTIVSNAFASNSVPTTSRIVVFQENVDTPTLNTDIIASISRDGGSNFTTATLSDSGYVTGSSGQRILTGQASISGQPSGQSMRWKLALANNHVKIHGVSLQWS